MTSSTVSSESAPRSSTNEAVVVTSSSLTPSCSTTIFLTRSSMVLICFGPPKGIKPAHCNGKWTHSPATAVVGTSCPLRAGLQRMLIVSQIADNGDNQYYPWRPLRDKPFRFQKLIRSRHVHAAVDVKGFAGDIGRCRRCQKCDRFGNVGRLAQSPQGNLSFQRLTLVVRQRTRHVGIDEARRHHIDGDAARPDLARQRFG